MPPTQHSTKMRSEVAKVMQRLFWCFLLMIAFGFASSLPAQELSEKALSGTKWQAKANCVSTAQLQGMVDSFPHQPATALPAIQSIEQAYCIQEQYIAALGVKLDTLNNTSKLNNIDKPAQSHGVSSGTPVGYKVGFTGAAGQQRFGISNPAVGILLQDMLVENGSTLPANFAFRGLVEPDVLVTVKSDAIMNAQSIEQVALHLNKLYAFIELPSVRIEQSRTVSAKELIALGIGATKMVVGESLTIDASSEFLTKLQQANTTFVDRNGKLIQQAPMSNLMGHPFNAVLWLITQLKQQGKALKKGDYISLGAVGKLFPVKNENQSYQYTIQFDNNTRINASVNFEVVTKH